MFVTAADVVRQDLFLSVRLLRPWHNLKLSSRRRAKTRYAAESRVNAFEPGWRGRDLVRTITSQEKLRPLANVLPRELCLLYLGFAVRSWINGVAFTYSTSLYIQSKLRVDRNTLNQSTVERGRCVPWVLYYARSRLFFPSAT